MRSKIEHKVDRSIVRLPGQNEIAVIIIAIVFLLLGIGIFWAMTLIFDTMDVSLSGLQAMIIAPPNDDGLVGYVFAVLALGFILVPIAAIVSIISGRRKVKGPVAIVFDHARHRVVVAETGDNPAIFDTSAQAGYDYSQIQELGVRHYTTTSSSSSGSSSTTHHYVACIYKKDGARLDLFHTYNQATADTFVADLQSHVDLTAGESNDLPAGQLRTNLLSRWDTGQSLMYAWKKPANFALLLITAGFMALFGFAFLRIPGEAAFPFHMFVIAFIVITGIGMVKGVWDGFHSLFNYHVLRLISGRVETGYVPKSLVKIMDTTAPDFSRVNELFKVRKSLAIKDVARVQFNYEYSTKPPYKLNLAGVNAAKAWDEMLSAGNLNFGAIVEAAKAGIKDNFKIELPGLRMTEIIQVEAMLEEDIRARGGEAL